MTFARALRYFLSEAAVNVARGWRVSLLAVLTIAVSLFVGGAFLQLGGSLRRLVEEWRGQARLVVYLRPEAAPEAVAALRAALAAAPWALGVEEIDSATAATRFREAFPSLADLLQGGEEQPLPASLEVAVAPARVEPAAFAAWLADLRAQPAAAMVDDDRDWLAQLEVAIALLRGAGLALGGVLLVGAVFTIASVVRLTAYLHAEEIAVLRLVGGTEFYIRGPFYVEGLLQGLCGGVVAAAALAAAHAALRARAADALVGWALTGAGLSLPLLAWLPAVGAAAGLTGAVVSLRRESLGATAEA